MEFGQKHAQSESRKVGKDPVKVLLKKKILYAPTWSHVVVVLLLKPSTLVSIQRTHESLFTGEISTLLLSTLVRLFLSVQRWSISHPKSLTLWPLLVGATSSGPSLLLTFALCLFALSPLTARPANI